MTTWELQTHNVSIYVYVRLALFFRFNGVVFSMILFQYLSCINVLSWIYVTKECTPYSKNSLYEKNTIRGFIISTTFNVVSHFQNIAWNCQSILQIFSYDKVEKIILQEILCSICRYPHGKLCILSYSCISIYLFRRNAK